MSDSFGRRNPYIIGRPITDPEQFFGRETLFQFIEDNLLAGAPVILLHGQRRIGKSSVLAQIPHFVQLKDFAFVSISLEGDSRKPLGNVLFELARDSVNQFDGLNDRIELPTSEELQADPQLFLNQFLPRLRQELGVKNLVYLLDEFDALADVNLADVNDAAGHLFPFLQTAVHQHRNLFLIPVVGRQLSDLRSLRSLFRTAPYREVGLLDRRSAEKLITKPAEGILEYFPGAIDEILELSAGHPYFTQLICFSLFANAREERRWKVIRDDVKGIVKRAIEFGQGGLAWFWDGISLPDRVVFAAAAEVPELRAEASPTAPPLEFSEVEPLELLRECGVVVTDDIRHSMGHLVEWKFLKPGEGRRPRVRSAVRSATMPPSISTYRVTIELVRRWLVKEHPIRKEIKALSALNPEAEELYETAKRDRQQHGSSPAIVTLLNRALKENPNHFGALLELATTYADLHEFAQAVKYYDRAYLIDPVRVDDCYVKALLNYAEELRGESRFDEASEQLEHALFIEPNNDEVEALLEQVQKAKQIDEKLRVSPPAAPMVHHSYVAESNVEDVDLEVLRHDFMQLVDQVNSEAPNEIRDKALDRLDDVQQEIFGKKEVDFRTLAYIHQWFWKNLPSTLAETVTKFVDTVIGRTFGREESQDDDRNDRKR